MLSKDLNASFSDVLQCHCLLVHVLERKPGKLPAATFSADYELEYGTDSIEMHQDTFSTGSRVLLVDDLLATGGTAQAALKLIQQLQGNVIEVAFLIELSALEGRQRLAPCEVFALMEYE